MKIVMVTGGARSGKSTFAENYVKEFRAKNGISSKIKYIATAERVDEEFEKRIKLHIERRGEEFETVEENLFPFKLLCSERNFEIAIIECIPTWLGNLYYHRKNDVESCVEKELSFLNEIKKNNSGNKLVLVVTNEIGLGLVPESKESREYRDRLGIINKNIAQLSDEVYITISGIPCKIK